MRKHRKILYNSCTRKEKVVFKATAIYVILLGLGLTSTFVYNVFKDIGPAIAIIGGVILYTGFCFAANAILTRGVRILEDGLIIPTAATSLRPRTFIPFSEISEIRLNTGAKEFTTDVEIQMVRGKAEKLSKVWLTNWEEFYRVLTEDLKGKIQVVE